MSRHKGFQGVGVRMKVLVLLLVAVLGCSLAERGMETFELKCLLKEKLSEAIGKLGEKMGQKGEIPVDSIVAKIVCHAEMASGFNVSKMTHLTVGDEFDHNQRRKTGGKPAVETTPAPEVWTLYGLFQLSNHIVCKDDDFGDSSPNLCGMDCAKLVDQDLKDDIDCVIILIENLLKKAFGMSPELRRMIRLIFQEECRNVKACEYFSYCH